MITFKNVTKIYDKRYRAIHNVSFNIKEGEFVFIVGQTGSGKTTLFKLLTKELEPESGNISVANLDLSTIKGRYIPKFRRMLGVIFQDFKLLDDRNVYDNVAFAQMVIGTPKKMIEKHVDNILDTVNLFQKGLKFPKELSGGEKQKVAIARALVNRPKILLADEPTGNLDEKSTNEIMDLLSIINEKGTTVVVITHDLHLVSRMNKRVIRLSKGKVISDTIGLDYELKELLRGERF